MMREDFDLDRLRACLGGAPVGAIRVSLGMASVEEDIRRLIELLSCFALTEGTGSTEELGALSILRPLVR
jgi:hypothetical protein